MPKVKWEEEEAFVEDAASASMNSGCSSDWPAVKVHHRSG